MFLTVGSGYLARAAWYYSEAAQDDALAKSPEVACNGCILDDNSRIMNAYVVSLQGKMQQGMQDMILNAGIGVTIFAMGIGFSSIYMKWYRNAQPILR